MCNIIFSLFDNLLLSPFQQEDEEALKSATGHEALIKSLLVCEKTILKDAVSYLSSRVAK